jgi:predicted glutamine amidotransferase
MCRWLAYSGSPVRPEWLLYRTGHGLIDQSLAAREMDHPINGDGFGMGWYGTAQSPGLYRNVAPAWSDRNLRELCMQLETPLYVAHVRASTGAPVQETNCHPFRYGRWLFVHNGFIDGYPQLRRELMFAVEPDLFAEIQGTTDSELLFYLALTFGLDEDPLPALERMAGFVESCGRRRGFEYPLQMTIGVCNGERLYAVRYASGQRVNTLYASSSATDLKRLYPNVPEIQALSDTARAIVSEPLQALPGTWHEVPPGTALIIQPGDDDELPFRPRAPAISR